MEEMLELKDRFKKFLDHYSLSPDSLSKKIGGSRGTYFAIQSGKSKPDFTTSENILTSFPEISAEWWLRGKGPMLIQDILSKEEAEALRAENRAVKAMYRAEVLAKLKGANLRPDMAKIHKQASGIETINRVRANDRKRGYKQMSVRVPGAKIPTLTDLFN